MTRPAISIHADPAAAAKSLAAECAQLVRQSAASGTPVVLGLATGSTPLPFYAELVRLHQEDGLSFRNVVSFNLDEYLGLDRDHPESYWSFMWKNLFSHIDIPEANVHLPPGIVAEGEEEAACAAYEAAIQAAGGIDFQILGIGRTGHIGFNEPGSSRDSRTRRIHLDPITRQDAAPAFHGLDNVPTHALTMGCGTILDAKAIRLMAWGEKKAEIVKRAVDGPVTDEVSASFLQLHPDARFILDQAAAAALPEAQG